MFDGWLIIVAGLLAYCLIEIRHWRGEYLREKSRADDWQRDYALVREASEIWERFYRATREADFRRWLKY